MRQPYIDFETPRLIKGDSKQMSKLGSVIIPTPSNLILSKLTHFADHQHYPYQIHSSLMGGEGTPAAS